MQSVAPAKRALSPVMAGSLWKDTDTRPPLSIATCTWLDFLKKPFRKLNFLVSGLTWLDDENPITALAPCSF